MIRVLEELTEQFRLVEEESYHHKNTNKIKYPYLTYNLSDEDFENMEGFYIDVDIFDNNSSYINIMTLENSLKSHFKRKDILKDDLLMRFNYLRGNTIDMDDDLLKRRSLQFYCKVFRRG